MLARKCLCAAVGCVGLIKRRVGNGTGSEAEEIRKADCRRRVKLCRERVDCKADALGYDSTWVMILITPVCLRGTQAPSRASHLPDGTSDTLEKQQQAYARKRGRVPVTAQTRHKGAQTRGPSGTRPLLAAYRMDLN